MVGAHNDLTNLKKVGEALKSCNEELKILVHDDNLTSLFNHHSVQEHFKSQMRPAGR
jgi:GGDEF domain-containing protein